MSELYASIGIQRSEGARRRGYRTTVGSPSGSEDFYDDVPLERRIAGDEHTTRWRYLRVASFSRNSRFQLSTTTACDCSPALFMTRNCLPSGITS